MKKTIFFMILILFFLSCVKPPAIMISAKLSFIKGDNVSVFRNGQPEKVKINMKLYPNDVVETGESSEARIMFADIGLSIIRQNTKVEIIRLVETYKSSEIRMNASKGKIFSTLKKLTRAKDGFEIHTPTAVVGVRGTTFLVNVVPEKDTRTAVFAGKVEIRKIGQPEKVVVVEELKEAILPESDFSKIKVIKMSTETFKEIKEIKEIPELKELNLPEIKEEIAQIEEKGKIIKEEEEKSGKKKVEPKKEEKIQW